MKNLSVDKIFRFATEAPFSIMGKENGSSLDMLTLRTFNQLVPYE